MTVEAEIVRHIGLGVQQRFATLASKVGWKCSNYNPMVADSETGRLNKRHRPVVHAATGMHIQYILDVPRICIR